MERHPRSLGMHDCKCTNFGQHSTSSRHWFDVEEVRPQLELKRLAARKSGLRFPEFEPALAMMLIQSGRWSILDLLNNRLNWRRKNNDNPFPSTYESSLEQWAEQLPDVDAGAALADGRSDLQHLHFVTIDPPDAKDFDDAVCLEEHDSGRTLWVAMQMWPIM